MKFYAKPYNGDVSGFYFETYDEFEEKKYNSSVEEFIIETIEGSCEELELINAIGVDQNNLKTTFDLIENVDESEWPKLFLLLDNNILLYPEDAKDKMDYVCLYRGNLHDAAKEFFRCMYDVPNEIQNYIDFDKFAKDLKCEGMFLEFEFGGCTYTCTNVNDL